MLKNGIILPLINKSYLNNLFTTSFPQNKNSLNNSIHLGKLINETIELGVLSSIPNKSEIFPNNIFIVHQEHRTTKNRLIFDMSFLNQFIVSPKFSLLKIPSILHILQKAKFAAKIDLSKAYYHIPIHNSFKKFFTFAFKNKKFCFNNMPFGLSLAPYIFTTIMTAVIVYIRRTYGIIIYSYLDDILILADNHFQIQYALLKVSDLFGRLGLTINYKASVMEPKSIITYLGITFNLNKKTMTLSSRNKTNLLSKINTFIQSPQASLRQIESVVGSLNFASTYTNLGKNLLQPVIYLMNKKFRFFHRDTLIKTPPQLKRKLIPWLQESLFTPIPITIPLPSLSVFVDASNQGWGATFIDKNHQYQEDGKSGGNPSSYKYLRNLSCPKSSHLSNQKRVSHKPILRFQNNNSMSSEARFLETSSKTRDHNYSSKIFESKQNQNFIPIHSQKNKHFCGFSIQEEKPFSFGNRNESRHLQSPTSETSIQVDDRSIHKREKLQTLSICNLNPFKHSSFRCISSRLEPTRKHIHVSSSISHQQSDLQTEENSSNSPCSIDNTQQTTSTMVLHTSKNLSQQFSPTTRRQLFTNNDIKRLEILSSAPISLNRLVPITSRFSSLSSSLQHKISSSIRESSSSTYQQLWKKLALFISERYGENKFPYIAIIDYFESLIDSKYSVSSIPRSRSAFHIPLKYYFPEQDLLQDEIINLLIKFHQRQQPKQILEFPSWELDLVLKCLEDLDVSSYDQLLEKTLFLTLLAFSARILEFQALSNSRSSINKEFMILQPRLSFTAKKSFSHFLSETN